jgi:hypothetical protein
MCNPKVSMQFVSNAIPFHCVCNEHFDFCTVKQGSASHDELLSWHSPISVCIASGPQPVTSCTSSFYLATLTFLLCDLDRIIHMRVTIVSGIDLTDSIRTTRIITDVGPIIPGAIMPGSYVIMEQSKASGLRLLCFDWRFELFRSCCPCVQSEQDESRVPVHVERLLGFMLCLHIRFPCSGKGKPKESAGQSCQYEISQRSWMDPAQAGACPPSSSSSCNHVVYCNHVAYCEHVVYSHVMLFCRVDRSLFALSLLVCNVLLIRHV